MTFAGLWDEWRNPETDELIHSCTMIVEEPGTAGAEQHDHMPVILNPTQFEPWLSGQAGMELLKPAGETMLNKLLVSKRAGKLLPSDADKILGGNVVRPD